jgi:hypothetical protein
MLVDEVGDQSSKIIADSIRSIPHWTFHPPAEIAQQLYKDKAIDAILTLKLGPDSLGTMMYFC